MVDNRDRLPDERRGFGGVLRRLTGALFRGERYPAAADDHVGVGFSSHHQAPDAPAYLPDEASVEAAAAALRPLALPVSVAPSPDIEPASEAKSGPASTPSLTAETAADLPESNATARGQEGRSSRDLWPLYLVDPLERTRAALDDARRQMPGMLGVQRSAGDVPAMATGRWLAGAGLPSQITADLRSLVDELTSERNQLSQQVLGLRSAVAGLSTEVSRLVDIVATIQSALPAPDASLRPSLLRAGAEERAEQAPAAGPTVNPSASLDAPPVDPTGIALISNATEMLLISGPASNSFGWRSRPEGLRPFQGGEWSPPEAGDFEPEDSPSPASDRGDEVPDEPASEHSPSSADLLSWSPAGSTELDPGPPENLRHDVTEHAFSPGGAPLSLVAGPFSGVKQMAAVEGSLASLRGVGGLQLVSYRGREAVFRLHVTLPVSLSEVTRAIEEAGGTIAGCQVADGDHGLRISLGPSTAAETGRA